jgi:5'-nucleotidase
MAFFLGGLDKTAVLKTFAPHIFFDDSIKHIDAARNFIPTALVPYHSTSLLHGDSYLTANEDVTLLAFKPVERPLFAVRH